jgi:hypothetical protein
MSDSKEKVRNTINHLDVLHRLFINHGDYGEDTLSVLDKG